MALSPGNRLGPYESVGPLGAGGMGEVYRTKDTRLGREGDTDFLVLKLIEGETLAARIAKGALPSAEVLKLGAQIADALDRAHRAGVMHRFSGSPRKDRKRVRPRRRRLWPPPCSP